MIKEESENNRKNNKKQVNRRIGNTKKNVTNEANSRSTENIMMQENNIVQENIMMPKNDIMQKNARMQENDIMQENARIQKNAMLHDNKKSAKKTVAHDNKKSSQKNIIENNKELKTNKRLPKNNTVQSNKKLSKNTIAQKNERLPDSERLQIINEILPNSERLQNNKKLQAKTIEQDNIIMQENAIEKNALKRSKASKNKNKKESKVKFHMLAIFCILIFCFALTPVTFQNDTYYSIAIGEHIVETKTVDMQDPFSWHEDLPYTYPHWLYDTATYLVYNLGETIGIGGFSALYIATILLSMILGLTIYYTANKLCKNPVVSFIITFIIMYLLKDFITARAQLVTYILFVLTVLFIEQFIKTKKKRYIVYLLIIPILIANLHCAVWPFYFVLFLPYIAEYLLVTINDAYLYYKFKIKWKELKLKLITKKCDMTKIGKLQEEIAHLQLDKENSIKMTQKRREKAYKIIFKKESAVKWLILVVVISLFTGLLTPLGTVPYTYLIKTMEGNTVDNISEHQPLVLINNGVMLTVFIVYVLLLIFTDTKATLRDFFMLGGLTILAFMSIRHAALFSIFGGLIFAKLITALVEKYDKTATESIIGFTNMFLGKVLIMLIAILISVLMFKDKIGDPYVSTSSYPVAASDYILENLDIENMKLFNEYNYGSYLLFRGIPVFIDSRADLYAPEFNGEKNENGEYEGRDIFSDYINTSNIGVYYEDKMEKYGITHVILGKKTKLNMFISRDSKYTQLYSDDYFVIYERSIY